MHPIFKPFQQHLKLLEPIGATNCCGLGGSSMRIFYGAVLLISALEKTIRQGLCSHVLLSALENLLGLFSCIGKMGYFPRELVGAVHAVCAGTLLGGMYKKYHWVVPHG